MVSYKGFDVKCITMLCAEGAVDEIQVGDFVTADGTGYAYLTQEGKPFVGVVVAVKDNYYTVQVSGYYEIKYVGEALPVYARLVANKRKILQNGGSTAAAPYRTVLWVDSVEQRAGILI